MKRKDLISRSSTAPPKWFLLPKGREKLRSYSNYEHPTSLEKNPLWGVTSTPSAPAPALKVEQPTVDNYSTNGNRGPSTSTSYPNGLLPPSFFVVKQDASLGNEPKTELENDTSYYPADYDYGTHQYIPHSPAEEPEDITFRAQNIGQS